MRYTLLALSTLFSSLQALTITSPSAGSNVDPSKPITITWTTIPSDPSTFTLVLSSEGGSVYSVGAAGTTLASNIPTAGGSYTVAANTIAGFGSGFSISARSPKGDSIGTSGKFLLGYASGQVVTGPNAQLSLGATPAVAVTTPTYSSIIFDTSGVTGSITLTYFTGISVTPTVGSASIVTGTNSVTGSMTLMPSSTRTGSASSSGGSSSTSVPTPASTINAQPRISAGREVVGVAGLLAGLVALVV